MKTMKMLSKRYLAMLLVFAMCFSMMHLSVYAAETEPDIDFTLTVGEDTEDLRESDKISDYLDPDTYVLSWSSSDQSVATVEDGVVTPVGAGIAAITCEVSLTEEAAAALAGAQTPQLPELVIPELPEEEELPEENPVVPEIPVETVPGEDTEDNTNTDVDVEGDTNVDTDTDVEGDTDVDTDTDTDVEDNTDADTDTDTV